MRVITHFGGHVLKPSIALPKPGKIVAIFTTPVNSKVAMVSYVCLSSTIPEKLYEQYRLHYKSISARWMGKLNAKTGLAERHVFWFKAQVGNQGADSSITYYFGNPNFDEIKEYQLLQTDRKKTLITITIDSVALDDMLRKQSEFTILL